MNMEQTLPAEFIEMLRSYGDDYAGPLLHGLSEPPQVSVRANILKGATPLPGADIVPWCEQGFYLPERPVFAADPAWHQGLYYVQDASSMIYGEAVNRIVDRFFSKDIPLRYLDACAAPGGKSIAALEALPPQSLVVSNELDRHRANILAENMAKEGSPFSVVCRGDASRLAKLKDAFDIVAVDAPCSGEGMMRKEAEAIRQWSQGLIADCAAVQREILSALWNALRPGGVLIYSTCTFNRTENELNVAFIAEELGGESIGIGLADDYKGIFPGIGTPYHCCRLAPGHVRGEGLFIAALRKPGDAPAQKSSKKTAQKPLSDFSRRCVTVPESFVEQTSPQGITLLPAVHAAFISEISRKTEILRAGLPVAVPKGRDYVPCHELALSVALSSSSFPHMDLDYAGAMAYLRVEILTNLPDGLPKDFVLVCYGGRPLGFVKNIGRRANNLYPDALRLRLSPRYLPPEAPASLITLTR